MLYSVPMFSSVWTIIIISTYDNWKYILFVFIIDILFMALFITVCYYSPLLLSESVYSIFDIPIMFFYSFLHVLPFTIHTHICTHKHTHTYVMKQREIYLSITKWTACSLHWSIIRIVPTPTCSWKNWFCGIIEAYGNSVIAQ